MKEIETILSRWKHLERSCLDYPGNIIAVSPEFNSKCTPRLQSGVEVDSPDSKLKLIFSISFSPRKLGLWIQKNFYCGDNSDPILSCINYGKSGCKWNDLSLFSCGLLSERHAECSRKDRSRAVLPSLARGRGERRVCYCSNGLLIIDHAKLHWQHTVFPKKSFFETMFEK